MQAVLPKKLSYAAISDMTGIDKETVRRSVKKLEEHGWLSIDGKTGIHYEPLTSNQDKLLMFNEWEIAQLGRLLKRVNDFQDTGIKIVTLYIPNESVSQRVSKYSANDFVSLTERFFRSSSKYSRSSTILFPNAP